MDPDRHLDAMRAAAAALLFAVESGAPDDPVPTCEGWEMHDLAVHVGRICERSTHVLCEATGRPEPSFAEPPEGDGVAGWLLDACSAVIDATAATDPATPVRTWFRPDPSARFLRRRLAHELTVHRFDAEWARGIPSPVPAELAADGIDEVVDVLVGPESRPMPAGGSGRRLGLRASDLGVEWILTLGDGILVVDRGGKQDPVAAGLDLVVTGTASDLELTLYGRPTLSPVDVHGDYTVLEEWHRAFRL